jgi:hypothetical protein
MVITKLHEQQHQQINFLNHHQHINYIDIQEEDHYNIFIIDGYIT